MSDEVKKSVTHEVNGIFFHSEDGFLIMEFTADQTVHRLKVKAEDAIEMAKVMSQLFLSEPKTV